MHRPTRWRRAARSGRTSVRLLLLTFALALGSGGTPAQAGTETWCPSCWVSSGLVVYGASHSLTASRGTILSGGGYGCGGAYNYGSYYCGSPAGCHTYSGSNVLTPAMRHNQGSGRSMQGYSTWGSDGPPANCGYAYVYGVAGPVTDAAQNPDGIPVLDRDTVEAPDALAEFVPKADLDAARLIDTPAGDAWVVVDAGSRLVCLVVDDRGTGYGYTCQRIGEVQSAGALSTLEDDDPTTAEGDVVIALAPDGVDELSVKRKDGSVRKVPVEQGAVVTTLTAKDEAVALPKADDAPEGVKARRLVVAK